MKQRILILMALLGCACPTLAHAEWTPLISSTFFDGIRADMTLAVSGIVGLGLIIFGLVMLYKVMSR